MLAGIPSASPLPSGRISFSPLHETDIRAATTAVRGRVNLAGWDHERGCSTDIHSLSPSWRVSVIAGNPVFSPLDHCRAFCTILPAELPAQLLSWRHWAE